MTRSARLSSVSIAGLAVAALLLSGCGNEPASGTGAGTKVDDVSTASTPSSTSSAADEPGSELSVDDVTRAAVSDLASRLGVDESAITVVSSEAVTWRDGSVGCPKKDMMYVQMLTPGYLVLLEASGQSYRYHSGRSDAPFLCEANAQDPLPPGDGPS